MPRTAYALLILTHLTAAVFFHEKSAIDLKGKASSSYGFSLGYQKGSDAKLVIGAPRYDHQGRVSQCSVKDIDKKGSCNDPVNIDFNNFPELKVNKTLNPDQYFYLGASIAATKKGFVTCAPLRTTNTTEKEVKYGAFGVCFAYDNTGKASKPATLWPLHSNYTLVEGGAGWSTLSDEKHDRIIISQFFARRNSVWSKMSKPENYTTLVNSTRHSKVLDKIPVYGQAITYGNYFDQNKTETYYAFSMKTLTNMGAIDFYPSNGDFEPMLKRLKDANIGSMFGAALCSADVTGDGFAELFVGAPAQVDDSSSYDRGAVHVYTKSLESTERLLELYLTIWGEKDGARFGTSLSTNDVDGDSYPEIFISAPFENSGGALYILCGYEIHKVRKSRSETAVFVSELPRTQRIAKSRSFGLSLQPINDYNENGSDELGVGSPDQSTVTVYRGVRAITVNVTSKFQTDAIANDTELAFSSCVTVLLPPKPKTITTKLLVKNVLIGEDATFKNKEKATYEINLQTDKRSNVGDNLFEYCRNFVIVSTMSCKVNTTVSLNEDDQNEKEFKNTWVTLSAQSALAKPSQPACICNGTTCSPEYTLDLFWAGINGSNHRYIVGSSEQETVSIVVGNRGTMGCGACADVRVSGTLDYTLLCDRREREYKCELPTPFRATANKTIDIHLLTNTLSNQERNLTIDVAVHKTCDDPEAVNSSLLVSYDFRTVLHNIIINGSTINLTISDTELQDTTENMLPVEQTFTIFNNQSFKWRNVWANIDTINNLYMHDFKIRMKKPMQSCVESNEISHFHWKCPINLAQNSKTEITVSISINKKELAKVLRDENTKIMLSDLKLELFPGEVKTRTLVTMMKFEREQTGSNNTLVTFIIAFIVALLVLVLITLILYKLNFFKRKNKEELEELKKEVRSRSMRSATSKSSAAQLAADSAPDQSIDVMDLIVDETPLDNSLSPAELNLLAAKSELGSKTELEN